MKNAVQRRTSGFTLIEILVVIGIIAILASVVIIAINPARQFAQARDSQRLSNLNSILNAIGQNMADNKGIFTCNGTPFTLPALNATSTISLNGVNIRPCLVPTYMQELPVDPSIGVAWDGSIYKTGYDLAQDGNGRVHIIASTTEPSIPRVVVLEVVR